MKKPIIFTLFFVMFGLCSAFAQTRTITGTVAASDDGQPLPYATVVVKGTTVLTTTGIDGKYTLNVPSSATTLVFTFIGMKDLEAVIGNRSIIDAALDPSSTRLDEAVIVGYGVTARGGSAFGAQSTVRKEQLEIPVTSFEKALQGNAVGVLSLSNSGQPGAGQSVVIRGMGSINAGTEPLYVLDGVPIITGNYGNMGQTSGIVYGDGYNAMAAINPNDIESVTILKDAAATSIYGARATNGVILITTKRGQAGKTRFNVKISNGFSNRTTKNFSVMNKDEYLEFVTEARLNAGYSDATVEVNGKPVLKDIADLFLVRNAQRDFYDFDWQSHAYIDNAPVTNVDFTMSGGSDKTKFYLSLSFIDQKGVVIDTYMKRYSGRLNLDHQINDKLKVSLGMNLSYKVQRNPMGGSNYGSPVFLSSFSSPLEPGLIEETSLRYVPATGAFEPMAPGPNIDYMVTYNNNFLATSAYSWMQAREPRAITTGSIQYQILDGLVLKSVVGLDYSYVNEYEWSDPRVRVPSNAYGLGKVIHSIGEVAKWNETTTLNYIKNFNAHNVNVLLGQELQGNGYRSLVATQRNFPGTDFQYISQGSEPLSGEGTRTGSTLASFFSTANYNFDYKYYLSASLRADGSSRLSANNRWATFWSVGASWKMASENFINNMRWINKMDLRASYGTAGNMSGISDYAALGLYRGGRNYNNNPGTAPYRNENPTLTWETTATFDIGYDISALNNRLGLTVDWYKRTTTDLLLNVPLSYTSGFTTLRGNVGELYNTGIELAFYTVPVRNQKLTWNLDFNFTSNKSKIVKLDPESAEAGLMEDSDMYSRYYGEGYPLQSWFVYRYAGVNPADGRPMYYDDAGEIVYSTTEKTLTRQYAGKADPKFYGSVTNHVSFMGFDFSMMFFFMYGNTIYDQYWNSFTSMGQRSWWNQHKSVATDRWRQEGDIVSYAKPMFGAASAVYAPSETTRSLFDGSYIRLREITLGYTLPQSWTNYIKTTSIRLYAQASNLFTLTRFPDADPEMGSGRYAGYYYNAYPNARTITFGIDVKF